jgi:hypothetical protein
MKVYANKFDLASPSTRQLTTPSYSDFGVGIKVLKNGADFEAEFTLEKDGETMTPEADKIDGYTVYILSSEGAGSTLYKVRCGGQSFDLICVATDEQVFEKKEEGGGGIVGSGFLDFSGLSAVPCASVGMSIIDNAADYKIIVADELYNDWKSNPFWGRLGAHMIRASEYLVIMTPYGGQDNMDD